MIFIRFILMSTMTAIMSKTGVRRIPPHLRSFDVLLINFFPISYRRMEIPTPDLLQYCSGPMRGFIFSEGGSSNPRQKAFYRIASKPINIRCIRTGSQSNGKIMSSIVLYPVFYEYKNVQSQDLTPDFLAVPSASRKARCEK